MVSNFNKISINGFSLIESVIALVIVSITIGSIYFALQSNTLLAQKIRDQILWQFATSNAYSNFILQNKLTSTKSIEGKGMINKKKYKWLVETAPTMIENLHTFEFFIIDSNDNKKKFETEYYVYFQSE